MPLTLTLTEGVLPPGQEAVAFRRLSDALLRWHGLTGNPFMTHAMSGTIQILPKQATYTGPTPGPVALIEWKVPPIAFTQREVQIGYIDEATSIIHELSGGRHSRAQIWVSVVHMVDGGWGIGGRAPTAAELGAAIAGG